MADAEKLYMRSPLVLWVETFKANDGHPLEYRDLCDGVFLNDVMQQIDPRNAYDNVNRRVEDATVRLHNWDILVKNIRGYYRDVLQQLLVMRLPNVNAICREPGKDSGFAEIRKALLLILGCAVQCEQKETFIDKIMAMDITAQTEIVDNIKEVTDDCETVLPIQRPESPASSNSYMDKMFHHLHRLIKERDECAELAADLGQERDFYMSQAEGKPVVDTPQMSPDKHHLALELAECKAKLRHIRQELEDRQEQLSDVRDELQDAIANCAQLKNENANLLQEARATRSLKDEVDILKEKASKVDMFEKEILKYKERLNELEFYKARTEELKEDNSILEETKAMLEDQLANSRKRIETVVELESELGKYRQQMEEITRERNADREKIEYLAEENARLEFEKKSSMNESASLETELSAVRSRIGNMGSSLSEQLSETSHARILRLELENQRLAAKLAEVKETALIQGAERSLELEKENQRLSKKVEKLQTSACDSSEQVIQMESELSATKEQKDRLSKALETVKENAERQVQELEKENEQLSQALATIRERSEKTNDVKVKDLERENKRLHEAVTAKNSQLNKLEFDHRQLQRASHQLQENGSRVAELELENQGLEKENAELHQQVVTLQHSADKLEAIEQENSDLSLEKHKLQKMVDTLQAAAHRREQLEQDHISLTVEHQRLQRTLESMKSESEKASELEAEKDELNKELQQLRKSLEGQKTQKLKQEQMEFEIIDMGNENQRLQKNLEVTTRRLQQLEKDNNDIESENERLNKEVETLKVTAMRLEDKDKEASQLEVEVQKLSREKATVEKENRKLKQTAELKDSSLEEINAKFQALDKESKALRKSVDKMKETCNKVKDLEKENKELLQELNTDRRTLATLREDLVNEKIRSQELNNELEQLTGELEKVGINTEKLTMAEQTNDANRYKALETMIEETLKKSSELKDEKIRALESRLEESKNRNVKIQDELRTVKRESEVLKQRVEEDEIAVKDAVAGREKERYQRSNAVSSSSSATKEIFQLKDHLVELERNNATLMAETDNLHINNSKLSEQCQKYENQLSSLQSQHASLQGHYSSLQEQNAKLQVEYTTLQSQTSSALSQQDVLKNQLSRLDSKYENLTHKHEGLQNTHQSLVSDHESLQHLHEQLTSEYESLVSEHGSLKSIHKNLKGELKDLQDQLDSLLQGKNDVNKLREVLERERDQLKRELLSVGNLQSDYNHLRDENQQMKKAYDKLSQDYSDVLASHKQVKTDYNNLQLKSTEQQWELNEAKENMSVADMEFQKLENKMETVYHINERIENENQALLLQIQQLLNQNHDLLTQALNSKDHFAEEEKAYLEKLSELRRQKERLEEKIMDHYKNRISPKKKGLGALIARKARGIISRGPRRSKSRNNLNELNDNSSQGSGSTEHMNDTNRRLDIHLERRRSCGGPIVEESAKLVKQNRSLAKSYTALNSPVSDNEQSMLRGAKSTENVNEAVLNESGLLPGVGRPYNMEDIEIPGPRATTPGPGRKTPGRSSPGSEMLTLDQFLKEANKSPRNTNNNEIVTDRSANGEIKSHDPVQRRTSNDSESRSSENSNASNNRLQQRQSQQRDGRSSVHPEVPDVAASSMLSPTSSRDLSTSRISRLSAGSGNENSFGSSGILPNEVFTSTPKMDLDSSVITHSNLSANVSRLGDNGMDRQPPADGGRYMSQKRLSGDDWRNSSQESSPYASTSKVNMHGNQMSSSPRTGSQTSSSTSLNQSHHHQHQQYPSRDVNLHSKSEGNISSSYNIGRELPPVPTEPPPPIPATERLDRLTMLSKSNDQTPSTHYAQPVNIRDSSSEDSRSSHPWGSVRDNRNSNNNNTRDSERDFRKTGGSDLDRSKSVGASERPQGLPNQFQSPIPRSQPGSFVSNHQNMDDSVKSGHNPQRRPSNGMAMQNNPPQLRARPASAMGQSPHIRGVYSRPPGEGRPRQQQQQQRSGTPSQPLRRDHSLGGSSQSRGEQKSSNPYSQPLPVERVERPKSVPPHLFNKPDDPADYQRRDMPIPPPRRSREGQDLSKRDMVREAPDGREPRDAPPQLSQSISLIREPNRSSSRPTSQSMTNMQDSQISRQQRQQPPPHPRSQQQQQQHQPNHQSSYPQQQNYSSHSPLSGSRQNSGSSLPPSNMSTSQQDMSQPGRIPTAAVNANNLNSRPSPGGQHSTGRPDSLPLAHSNHTGPSQGSQQSRQGPYGYGSGSNRIPPHSSTMPRSHSSMGNPVGNTSSPSAIPPGAPYGRSTTPGLQHGRADHPQSQYSRNTHETPTGHQSGTFGGAGHPSGPGPSNQGGAYSQGLDTNRDSRQFRGGSEPRDMSSASRSGIYTPSHSQQSPRGQNNPYHTTPSTTNSNPPPRSHPQGPPQQYQNSSHTPQSEHISNGPSGPSRGSQPDQQNAPQPQQHVIPPQIRSQGKPPLNFQPNSISSGNRSYGPPSQLRSRSPDAMSPDRGGASLPSPVANTVQVAPSKTTPTPPPRSEREAEGEQVKHTNSIWYEYGCV